MCVAFIELAPPPPCTYQRDAGPNVLTRALQASGRVKRGRHACRPYTTFKGNRDMKRILLVMMTMLLLASCADYAVAQGPLKPQDGAAAGLVSSLKWSNYGWEGIDTLAGTADSIVCEFNTASVLWNRWAFRMKIDSIGTDPDSVSMRWQYKLNGDTAWSASIVVHQIVANGYPVSGSISKALTLTGLAEKPDKIKLCVRLFDGGTDKAIIKKIELVTQ